MHRGPDEVADETVLVIDQALLECDHGHCVRLLQFDGAGDAGHEGLGVIGQAVEDAHQVAQGGVHLGRIGCRLARQCQQRIQLGQNIFEGDSLQFALARQGAREDGKAGFHRLPA